MPVGQLMIGALRRSVRSAPRLRRSAQAHHVQGTPVKIHEYQAKAILARHGVPVPRGEVAFSAEEAGAIARRLGGGVTVVKAQIHAGGRGKGGGVKVVKDAAAAEEAATRMIGMTLVTHQTGPEGRTVERLLVEEGVKIAKELYLGLLVDRAAGCPVLMASSEGGMDIEEVAEKNPDAIKKVAISPITGLTAFQARQLAFGIGLALASQVHDELSLPGVPFLSFALFLGVAMSITAFPVLARLLTERGMVGTPLGSIVLAAAAIDDVTAWCLLAFVVSFVRAEGASAALVTVGLALAFALVMLRRRRL